MLHSTKSSPNSSILSQINIVVGPDMSEGDRLLLNSLLANYSIERSRVMESRFVDDAFLNNLSEKAKYENYNL